MDKKVSAKLKMAERHGLGKAELHQMLRTVILSRKLDDTEIAMRKKQQAFFQISGAGHEGVLVAAASVLRPAYDYFLCYYRDRALCLGLGVTPYEMLCQANGNTGDTSSKGRQMPAHWGNKALNIVNKSSCTGTQFLQAVGLAEGGRYLASLEKRGEETGGHPHHSGEIVYTSCGDGTTAQGEFWEALTTASVQQLPVLFHVEDNAWAISVPVETQTPTGSISRALESFPGLAIFECDGNCPIESYAAFVRAEKHLRGGKGPVLLHSHVTRPYGHSLSDDHRMYRTQEELQKESARDVVNSFPRFLVQAGLMSEKEHQKLVQSVDEECREAYQRAVKTPWPDKDSALDYLYSARVDITSREFEREGSFQGTDDIPMASAINAVLKGEFQKNPLLRLWGQDVADFGQMEKLDDPELKGKGGVFKVSAGVQRTSRPEQVFNSPLAEANIVGRAIGQAYRGIRPVVEIQFFDYIWTAYMQIKNELATSRYRSGGDYPCPVIIRVPIGGYLRGGAIYHSQSGESLYTHIPGLRVAFPSNAADAAGLLRTALRADDPVLFLEHKHLYYQGHNRCADPGEDYCIPFGRASVVREGADATLVAWGALVSKSLEAAKQLEGRGKSVEVLDLRTLAPFDLEAIQTSLAKTGRLLIAHEETKTSGFAGEIAASVNETCFELLDAPILRVAAQDVHVAYCPDLEEAILPQVEDVVVALDRLLAY